MKRLLISILIFIVSMVFIFMIFAFAMNSLNIGVWPMGVRAGCAFVLFIMPLCFVALYLSQTESK